MCYPRENSRMTNMIMPLKTQDDDDGYQFPLLANLQNQFRHHKKKNRVENYRYPLLVGYSLEIIPRWARTQQERHKAPYFRILDQATNVILHYDISEAPRV
jgi:hypothetical protein